MSSRKLFHPVLRRAPDLRESRSPKLSSSVILYGRGRIRFLGSALRDCSFASSTRHQGASTSPPRGLPPSPSTSPGRRLASQTALPDHRHRIVRACSLFQYVASCSDLDLFAFSGLDLDLNCAVYAVLAGLADLDGLAVLADLSIHAGLIRSEVYLSILICTLTFIIMVFYRIDLKLKC